MFPGATFLDVSQSISRLPHRFDQNLFSFNQKSFPYYVPEARVITGREMMRVHGFPEEKLAVETLQAFGTSDMLMRDLAGEPVKESLQPLFSVCF